MFFASWFTNKILFNNYEEYRVQLEEDKATLELIEEKSNLKIICDYNAYNCEDFSTCSEVMEIFYVCGYDVHYLDGDDDGIPCEILCS